MEKLLLRVAEAAEIASVSRTKAYELIAAGSWPSVRVGTALRVPLADLKTWVEEQKSFAREGANRRTDAA
ncbi:MAG: helix-turn-helix domain-containing protein [Chloroflexota bacterium]|nr:helix-turn-helix domain-containing protein [Chloroflexota bacterium]